MLARSLLFAILLNCFSSFAFAGPSRFDLQGQIVKPDGALLEAPSVDFLVQIYSPLPDKCLLYEERFTAVNMSGSRGLFKLSVGAGVQSGSDFEDSSTLTAIFNNRGGVLTPTTCEVGGPTYAPGSSDGRLLRLTFDDGSGAVTLAQDHVVNSVPFAQYASSVEGLGAADILSVNTSSAALTQGNLENIFATAADVTDLRSLIDGNSGDYLTSTPSGSVGFNNQRITDVATPSLASDAANKNYVDSNLGGNTINTGVLGAGESGNVLTWNGSQWESQTLAATGDVNNNGNAFGGLMTLGTNDNFGLNLETNGTTAVTIDSTQGVSMAAGLGVTGGINAGGSISLLTQSELRLEDASGGEYMALRAPTTVTANTVLTLPNGDGGANQVLATDGSGQLIWATDANTDAIDTVFGRSGTVTAATSDYDAIQVDNTPAGDIAAITVQGAIDEIDTEKVAKAGDTMTGNLNLATQNELRLQDDAGGDYVGLRAPVGVASYTMDLPNVAGTLGQSLKADASGNLVWGTDTDTDTTYTADGEGLELSTTTFGLELDGTTLSKSATGLKVNSITNTEVSASADIARSKFADGAANRILVNDGSGVMTDAAAITANMALISNANGIPVADTGVSATELGYVDGVTSGIQTQLDGKLTSTLASGQIFVWAMGLAQLQALR